MTSGSQPSWADLAGRRVGIWGLGIEGRAAVGRLAALGTAPVVVADDSPGQAGPAPTSPIGDRVGWGPVLRTADALDRLATCDVVVKTPGISRYRPEAIGLRARGVHVTTGLSLWLNGMPPERVVGITGSKGKSTTTSIAGHLAAGLGIDVAVGGNLGLPPFAPEAPPDAALWLVEVSSYQAADLERCPAVTAVTSLSPDHLPWHEGSVERYYSDKLRLCAGDEVAVVVAADANTVLRDHASSLRAEIRWVPPIQIGGWADALGLPGAHNRANAAVAAEVLAAAGVDGATDENRLRRAAAGFRGLPSRLHTVAHLGGVAFVDDSLSTNALPTMAAVDSFPDRRVAVVLGGQDRAIDYQPLALHLARAARHRPLVAAVLVSTESGPRMVETLRRVAPEVALFEASRLEDLVVRCAEWAQPDGVVLLSPAAPSFGQFANFASRGRAFSAAASALGAALVEEVI